MGIRYFFLLRGAAGFVTSQKKVAILAASLDFIKN